MDPSSPSTERFQTATTILIAIVSTVMAVVASQVAAASGDTTDAWQSAVLARINRERADAASQTQIERNERAFRQYRFTLALWELTSEEVAQAEAAGPSAHGTRLRQEAAGQREAYEVALQFVHGGYLLSDESGAYTGFDAETFQGDARQTAAIYQDIDPADDLRSAETSGRRALMLSGSLVVLFVSVMFFTWAQIARSFLRWLWLALGLIVALGTGLAYLAGWVLGQA